MKKASSFIALVLLGSLMADAVAQTVPGQYPGSSFPPYTQPGHQHGQSEIISERVLQQLGSYERLRLVDILRLSPSETRDLEVVSLTVLAKGIRGQATLDVLERDRSVAVPQLIRKQITEVRIPLSAMTKVEELELAASDEMLIDTVTLEVRSRYGQGGGGWGQPLPEPQVMSGQSVKLPLNQQIRVSGELPLRQLVKQQLGLSLEGAQIERIAIQATLLRGASASVSVEMNQRVIAIKAISGANRATPILLNTIEDVRSNLRLIVRGDVVIHQVMIKVGHVRPTIPQQQIPQRIQVSQEIGSGRALELSHLLPYEGRLISTISLEARTLRQTQAEVALVAMSQVVASAIVAQVPMRPVLQLIRPMSARELRLQSLSPVMIDAIEVGFESRQMW